MPITIEPRLFLRSKFERFCFPNFS